VNSEPLFDSRERDDDAYKRARETMYAFLDRVCGPELAAPREVLNAWFERWPADDREGLRTRLMSKDRANFDGGFWELYLHEVHWRLGFEITREPEVPGRRTRPDFLIERADGAFYLEATVIGQPASVVARRRREEHVIEQINHAYHPDFGLRLQGLSVGPEQPSRRAVVAAVERWLGTLDWEAERTKLESGGASIGDRRRDIEHIEVRGTHILALPWPRAAGVRGDRNFPTVVAHSGQGGVLNEPPAILDDLKDKAGKFGRLDRPYVIATLSRRDFVTDLDVEQALFGPEVVRIPVRPDGPLGDPRLDRQPRGFWQHDDRKQATRVSAVLSATNLNPWAVDEVPRLWRNPWAARPLVATLPWTTIEADLGTNQLVRHEARIDARELLGLPPD
jgi:hypothetical protein